MNRDVAGAEALLREIATSLVTVQQVHRRAVMIGRLYQRWKTGRPTRLERAALVNELVALHADLAKLQRDVQRAP
jgi:hypothetical protein